MNEQNVDAVELEIAALYGEYTALCHAMQTGVALELERDNKSGTPKHLRVGINSGMVNNDAVATLLIEKGVFTKLEYVRSLRDAMKREVERYQAEINRVNPGTKITLM